MTLDLWPFRIRLYTVKKQSFWVIIFLLATLTLSQNLNNSDEICSINKSYVPGHRVSYGVTYSKMLFCVQYSPKIVPTLVRYVQKLFLILIKLILYFWPGAKNLLRSRISEASVNSRNGVKLGQ